MRCRSRVRRPGFVISRRRWMLASFIGAASRTVRLRSSRQVWLMRQLPRLALFLRDRRIYCVVQPAPPFRRHGGRVFSLQIDHPAFGPVHTAATSGRACGFVIASSVTIFANKATFAAGMQPCSEVYHENKDKTPQAHWSMFFRARAINSTRSDRARHGPNQPFEKLSPISSLYRALYTANDYSPGFHRYLGRA